MKRQHKLSCDNCTFARCHHFVTTTRINFVFDIPAQENVKLEDSGSCSQMTLSCKSPINNTHAKK